MIEAYAVVQGEVGRHAIERVLRAARVSTIEVVAGADRSDAIGYAASLRWAQQRPTALVLDSDTVEERSLELQRVSVAELLGPPSERLPGQLILAAPQVEAVLFSDRAGLERALGREIADDDVFEARFRPKAVFQRLLGDGDAEARALAVIDALDDDALRRMARHPVIREITGFAAEIEGAGEHAHAAPVRRAG
jgi:hypothetical protein